MSYSKRIDYTRLFLEPPGKNYRGLQIDRESISYITTPQNTATITNILLSNLDFRSDVTIFDSTSGVGGDTVAFGLEFDYVVGCEINKERFAMLKNNIRVFNLQNITIVNDDALKLMFDLNFVNVVYIDPPWGGKNYKKEKKLRLTLGSIAIETIIADLMNPEKSRSMRSSELKLIVLKLPKNYDLEWLYKNTKNDYSTLLMYELEKMLIMVFKIGK